MTTPASPPVAGVDAEKIITEAVFFGFEHGQCEAEWEPERAKEIVDRCLRALASPGDGSSADADTHRSAEGAVVADRLRDAIREALAHLPRDHNAHEPLWSALHGDRA